MNDALAIVSLQSSHAAALAELFDRIAADEASHFFHPHPFDAVTAQELCTRPRRDLYFAVDDGARFVAYGMLRGFDEGFAIPSLGIYVAPEWRGRGAARALMEHLHAAARDAGAPSIRLKVYPDNGAAISLYEALGYVFDPELDASGQRVGRLALPAVSAR